jgi:hypothetical protein
MVQYNGESLSVADERVTGHHRGQRVTDGRQYRGEHGVAGEPPGHGAPDGGQAQGAHHCTGQHRGGRYGLAVPRAVDSAIGTATRAMRP